MRSPPAALAALVLVLPPAVAVAEPPLGEVTDVQVGEAFCGEQPLTLARPYTCVEATVACPGINPRVVDLRITEPPDVVPLRGTVVMGMGGAGTSWYELVSTFARDLLDALNAEGFRVVQRRWGFDPTDPELFGWFSGSLSLHHSACRYATLLDWIHDESGFHEPGVDAFCATGNSGGSSEIGYALAVYGMGALLDLALPTAGPPHGVVDRGCGVNAEAWEPLSTGPTAFHVIPGAPHTMPATAAGAQAIHDAITFAQGCVLRHPPS